MTLVTPINSKALLKVHRLDWAYTNNSVFKEVLKIPDVWNFLCIYKNKITFSWFFAAKIEIDLKRFVGFCCPWLKEKYASPSRHRTVSNTAHGGAPRSSAAPSTPRQLRNLHQWGWKPLTPHSPPSSTSVLHKQDQSCAAYYQTIGIWTCWLAFSQWFFLSLP